MLAIQGDELKKRSLALQKVVDFVLEKLYSRYGVSSSRSSFDDLYLRCTWGAIVFVFGLIIKIVSTLSLARVITGCSSKYLCDGILHHNLSLFVCV
jgi:hypothetical protein